MNVTSIMRAGEVLTIMIPQQNMSNESHIDGRRRLRNTFEGTYVKLSRYILKLVWLFGHASKIAYEKKKIVRAIKYC